MSDQRRYLEQDGTLKEPRQVERTGFVREPLPPVKQIMSMWSPLPVNPDWMPESCFCLGCHAKIQFVKGQMLCGDCADREAHELAGMEHHESMRGDR